MRSNILSKNISSLWNSLDLRKVSDSICYYDQDDVDDPYDDNDEADAWESGWNNDD